MLRKDILKSLSPTDPDVFSTFPALSQKLRDLARDPVVVEFESAICYRTSLNISVNFDDSSGVETNIVATVSSSKPRSRLVPCPPGVIRSTLPRPYTALSTITESRKPGECKIIDHPWLYHI